MSCIVMYKMLLDMTNGTGDILSPCVLPVQLVFCYNHFVGPLAAIFVLFHWFFIY